VSPGSPVAPLAASAVSGAVLALRGLRLALGNREVRKIYLRLALALMLTSIVLVAGLGYAIWALIPAPESLLLAWTLRIVGTVLTLLAAPLLALFVVNIVFPFLGEDVFLAGLRAVDPARADELAAAEGTGFAASTANSLRRLLYFVGVTLLSFMLALVPVLGAVLGPLAQLWFGSRMLSWELLDPYFDRRGLDHAGQRATMKAHRSAMFGFGVPWTLLLAIPIVGPLGFGLAQAAAALLVTDVLEPRHCVATSASARRPDLQMPTA